MTVRRAVASALFSCVFFAATASAQSGDRLGDMKARVINLVFPLDSEPHPYFWKMILRFGDPESQIVVIVHPGGKSEVVRYDLGGMNDRELSQLIDNTIVRNPQATAQEVAAKLTVTVDRAPIDLEALERARKKLDSVRMPPVMPAVVCFGECPRFEYWYDSGEESVHYVIVGSGNHAYSPDDHLVIWMVKFRKKLPELMKLPPASSISPP